MFFLPLVVSYAFETSMLIRHGQGTPSKTPLPLRVGERDPVSRSVINRAMCLITWKCACVCILRGAFSFTFINRVSLGRWYESVKLLFNKGLNP